MILSENKMESVFSDILTRALAQYKTMTELQREVVDEWLKASAGIKNLENLEKTAVAKLKQICVINEKIILVLEIKKEMKEGKKLKISLGYHAQDLERVREKYLEGLEKILTELKKERENWCRIREKIKHISRKILLKGLETLAEDLEDGVELSEQQERDHVKAMADKTMEEQREIGRVTIRMIGEIDALILELEDTKKAL